MSGFVIFKANRASILRAKDSTIDLVQWREGKVPISPPVNASGCLTTVDWECNYLPLHEAIKKNFGNITVFPTKKEALVVKKRIDKYDSHRIIPFDQLKRDLIAEALK